MSEMRICWVLSLIWDTKDVWLIVRGRILYEEWNCMMICKCWYVELYLELEVDVWVCANEGSMISSWQAHDRGLDRGFVRTYRLQNISYQPVVPYEPIKRCVFHSGDVVSGWQLLYLLYYELRLFSIFISSTCMRCKF